ncbi:5473_t:CDS:1 [Paraglomus brasilianum]|uniref:5473_t:CDS:1 n=1 Tax=Paraglomus brasilianum TaxID=144538 RepID=A0A9N8ZJR3_9GLOM|nr:5473_t:CDS:1 [Paraglomus brasilianum]
MSSSLTTLYSIRLWSTNPNSQRLPTWPLMNIQSSKNFIQKLKHKSQDIQAVLTGGRLILLIGVQIYKVRNTANGAKTIYCKYDEQLSLLFLQRFCFCSIRLWSTNPNSQRLNIQFSKKFIQKLKHKSIKQSYDAFASSASGLRIPGRHLRTCLQKSESDACNCTPLVIKATNNILEKAIVDEAGRQLS